MGEAETSPRRPDPTTGGPPCVCWPRLDELGEVSVRQRLPAVPHTVRVLRRHMQRWVRDLGIDQEHAEAVVLIVDEAVTNAVEHACPDRDCEVHLVAAARACGGGIAVLVADDGEWRPPGDPGHRGRGVQLMGTLSDRSSIDAGPDGTTVRMCWSLPPRPAVAGTAPTSPATR